MAADEGTRRKKIRAKDVFEVYFLKHHRCDILTIMEADNEDEHYSVIVNFLTLFEEHVEVAESLLASPVKLLPVLDMGLLRAALKVMDEVKGEKEDLSMKTNIHARITGLPTCPELYRHAVPRTSDVGRLLCVSGTVVRTTAAKMLEYQKDFMCIQCKHVFTVKADHDQYYVMNKPSRCPNPEECYCNNFTPLGASSHPLHTKDYQEIKIQEQVRKLVIGTIPRSLWVTLEDDLVDSCKPGDDVLICGTVHRRWLPVVRDSRPNIDLVLKANNIAIHNKQRSGNIVTDEMREEFAEFWEHHKYDPLRGRDIILSSFCPQVYGLYVVKLAVAVVVVGGVQKIDTSCTRIRGESHLLLVGDPGTGKSQFLKYVCNLVPRCVLTTGIGTTNAGLTVAAVRDEGEWALEAGALVLADGGICCIDEFSSVRDADRGAIHEAMEQQTISVAKAGLVCKLNTRCSIIAATNPKGQFDPTESLATNISLGSPLLSRFDLVLVLLDTRNTEWDKIVSDYVLKGRDPLSGDGGREEDWSLAKLQAYFCHVRSIQPAMTPKANIILSRYYQAQRKTDQRSQARTTIRMLESLVRLSQGHAKLMMRTEVTVQDAIVAVTLMEATMCGASVIAGINPLHTSFPHSPGEEYKHQAKTVLQNLALFDILSDEVTRLNQQRKLFMNWKTAHPKSPQNEKCDYSRDTPINVQYYQKKNFKTSVNQDKTACGIEELDDVPEKNSKRKQQQTLPQMSKNLESSTSSSDLDVSFSTARNDNGKFNKIKKTKGIKRTIELVASTCENLEDTTISHKKVKNGKSKKTVAVEETCSGKEPSNGSKSTLSQSHVDKAGDELLEDLEDFETEPCTWNPLKLHDKNTSVSAKFSVGRKVCKDNVIKTVLDIKKHRDQRSLVYDQVTEDLRAKMENEKNSDLLKAEEDQSIEHSDEVDFYENVKDFPHLNVSQKTVATDVNSLVHNNASQKFCESSTAKHIETLVMEKIHPDDETQRICSQLQRQEESTPALDSSSLSHKKSISSKLSRFSIHFHDCAEKDTVINNNKVSSHENPYASRNEQPPTIEEIQPVLPFKTPSFFKSQEHKNSKAPVFLSGQPQFGSVLSSEELDDADFDFDL